MDPSSLMKCPQCKSKMVIKSDKNLLDAGTFGKLSEQPGEDNSSSSGEDEVDSGKKSSVTR